MAKSSAPPPSPESLFAAFHALKADPDASAAQYDALSKRARAAKAAYKKAGDVVRMQQCSDVQGYLARSKPSAAEPLTAAALGAQLSAIRAMQDAQDQARAARALARRICETRDRWARDGGAYGAYDEDHDELVDGEGALTELALELGVELEWE